MRYHFLVALTDQFLYLRLNGLNLNKIRLYFVKVKIVLVDKLYKRVIMITGGAGFIGSHLVRRFVRKYPEYLVINVDKLTYAGNLENLTDIEKSENYIFEKVDICDSTEIRRIFEQYDVDGVIHLAAESHVDRSIHNPLEFINTNIVGTANLLETARRYWESLPEKYYGKTFYHVSTDEVYGSLGELDDRFTEETRYDPHSPYSASKASSDHIVRSYFYTYGMPTVISNCSNNYGPNQFPEKLIPLVINNIVNKKPIPIYGDGRNVRDWLYVKDHANAIDVIFHRGKPGETYNIGGFNEIANIDLVRNIIRIADDVLGREIGEDDNLITFVKDRKGHDRRYAIDSSKLQNELGWFPSKDKDGLMRETVKWYLDNEEWLDNCTSGEYLAYYDKVYNQNV